MTPDQRRAVRTTLHAFGAVTALGYLGWIIHRLPDDRLHLIALGLLALLLLREFFHGAENVVGRLKFSANKDGASAEVDNTPT